MAGMLSDRGNVRATNQDSIGCIEDDKKRLYVIADGMGGMNAGEVASNLAVNGLKEYIQKNFNDESDISKVLESAVKYANDIVYRKSMENEKMHGMGTTITACLIRNDDMSVANVGDSSFFVISNNEIKKVTKDHSYVQQLIDSGEITFEQSLNHPKKNIITRALGVVYDVKVDIFKVNMKNIFKAVLCTDGLTNEVTRQEMYDIIISNDERKACEKLIELCKSRRGRDNISVIVFGGECK